jgi:hypothetical protein
MEFIEFPKIARLSREIVITEKIDGTNAQICITEDGEFYVGSRTRWITPEDDNFGFARWAYANKDELMTLGNGSHFGEWWGQGIQRKYDLDEKRFSLFNVERYKENCPACCHVVPELYRGIFDTNLINDILQNLILSGSIASPKFMNPEGIVIWHEASRQLFKKTIHKDDEYKGKSA